MKRAWTMWSIGLLIAGTAVAVSGQEAGKPPDAKPEEGQPTGGPGVPKPIQNILLTNAVKAGELTLFVDRNDEKQYYYLPDKPRLATGANGASQLSFLRWVENARTGDAGAGGADGGGILHAVVSMGVSDAQLQQARSELQRDKPGARIVGPVMFTGGVFGLVSSFKEPSGKIATKVVGLGNAPLLDGQKAAVSISLNKMGAQLLWESFKTPTPDITFQFEMELTGWHRPYRSVLEADFEKIYKHQAFDAGIAHRYLGGEIHLAFEELRQTGAIKLEQDGMDTEWDKKVQSAYTAIASMMFDKTLPTADAPEATGQPAPAPAPDPSTGQPTAAEAGKQAILDRAMTMLKTARTGAEATQLKNKAIREQNKLVRERNKPIVAMNEQIRAKQKAAASARTEADEAQRKVTAVETQIKTLKKNAAEAAKIETAEKDLATRREAAKSADEKADMLEADAPKELLPLEKEEPELKEESVPPFAVLASYRMKKERRSGKFRIDLNKYTVASLTMPFAENIGDVRSLLNTDHFRQVNLDDPLYRQREIAAYLDGSLNAEDFGKYVNFVSVQMRKKHAGGEVTDAELNIDRANFNAAGNNFKLLYGWKGDNDRRRWLDYEYRTVWSFFGGRKVEQPWRQSQDGAIPLSPPFQRQSVEVQADPEMVATGGVRVITVKVFYNLGAGEQVRQITLNAFKNVLSGQLEFMLPANNPDYAYEAIYQVKGNRTVSTGKQRTSAGVLILDELPK